MDETNVEQAADFTASVQDTVQPEAKAVNYPRYYISGITVGAINHNNGENDVAEVELVISLSTDNGKEYSSQTLIKKVGLNLASIASAPTEAAQVVIEQKNQKPALVITELQAMRAIAGV